MYIVWNRDTNEYKLVEDVYQAQMLAQKLGGNTAVTDEDSVQGNPGHPLRQNKELMLDLGPRRAAANSLGQPTHIRADNTAPQAESFNPAIRAESVGLTEPFPGVDMDAWLLPRAEEVAMQHHPGVAQADMISAGVGPSTGEAPMNPTTPLIDPEYVVAQPLATYIERNPSTYTLDLERERALRLGRRIQGQSERLGVDNRPMGEQIEAAAGLGASGVTPTAVRPQDINVADPRPSGQLGVPPQPQLQPQLQPQPQPQPQPQQQQQQPQLQQQQLGATPTQSGSYLTYGNGHVVTAGDGSRVRVRTDDEIARDDEDEWAWLRA
ncbi:MAG: hypothetical protein HOE82_08495 [Gammaproteobacteria bacterium]|jgi:hypothetical protein|nr:hypothetical protein [Gammaproteobacteria bacterium]